jgi:hypothetical protein
MGLRAGAVDIDSMPLIGNEYFFGTSLRGAEATKQSLPTASGIAALPLDELKVARDGVSFLRRPRMGGDPIHIGRPSGLDSRLPLGSLGTSRGNNDERR